MIKLFLSLFLFANLFAQENKNITLIVNATKFSPIKIKFVQIGINHPELSKIISLIAKDFEFSGQFEPGIALVDKVFTRSEIKNLSDEGFAFILFLTELDKKHYEVRLYDTSEQEMIFGKKVKLEGEVSISSLAHEISDHLWPILTGFKSSFSSLIAACKKVKPNSRKEYSYIYVFYPTEPENKRLLVNSPTLNIMPRWNPNKPILYFSQHTPLNVRLLSVDTYKNQKIAANFEGLNMTPAFSQTGDIIVSITKDGHGVLCKYTYDELRKKGVFKGITKKKWHAVSPSFIDENRIVFCLIENHRPNIAILDLKTHKIEKITSGFCACPAYSKSRDTIIYCRKSGNFMQIFSYDLKTKEHKQITSDIGDKDECCWSTCGNFIIYSIENRGKTRLAMLNMISRKVSYLTNDNEVWNYPSLSPIYSDSVFI